MHLQSKSFRIICRYGASSDSGLFHFGRILNLAGFFAAESSHSNHPGNAQPSRKSVIAVTEHPLRSFENPTYKEDPMPVLMIALFALACFGVIGILLAAAVVFEPRKSKTPNKPTPGKAA
jgi:hypothetical protein